MPGRVFGVTYPVSPMFAGRTFFWRPPLRFTLAHTFESGQADGTTITTGNSATGGNAFDTVTIDASCTATYDATPATWDTLSGHFTTPAGGGVSSITWLASIPLPSTQTFGRVLFRPVAPLNTLTTIIRCRGGGVQSFRIRVNSGGTISLSDTGSTNVATSSGAITTADTWLLRWEVNVGATGSGVLYIHYDATDPTPDETLTVASADFGANNIDEFNAGVVTTTVSADLIIDELVCTNEALPDVLVTAGSAVDADASLAVTATLTAAAVVEDFAAATLPVTATLTASATASRPVQSSLAATATLTASATATRPASSSLAATATLTAAATGTRPAQATLPATATLTAAGDVELAGIEAQASLAVTATLTASATRTAVAGASLPVTATLTATGTGTRPATASLPVTATLATAALRTAVASASLPVTATLTTSATAARPIAATLPVIATLTADAVVGTPPIQAAAALAVTATLTSTASRVAPAGASLALTASLSAAGLRTAPVAGVLTVTATITTDATGLRPTDGVLAVTVTLVAAAGVVAAPAAITLRPDGGIELRPFTTTTTRPGSGTQVRPGFGNTTVRPFSTVTIRP